MISDLYADDALAAARDAVRNPRQAPPQPRRTSVWQDIGNFATAIPRGVSEAAVQVGATLADTAAALRYMGNATPAQRKAMDSGGLPVEAFSSETGDNLREFGRMYRPDAETAHWSEQVLYGFARGATKIVGGAVAAGPAGVLAAGLEEGVTQADELRMQGVGADARSKAGAVQGAGLALAALPLVGTTMGQTAALYVAGGPGGFVAQQALTREILQSAGHAKVAQEFDPFDPVGLAVASLVPAGFAAYGLRAQRLQRAAASLPADVRDVPGYRDATPAADAALAAPPAPFPSKPTATAQAARDYTPGSAIPDDVVDAAMVSQLAHARRASNPTADAGDLRAGFAHEAALARAEEQIAAGERVSVADVAPASAADVRAEPPPLPRITGADLVGRTFEELDAMHADAVAHNRDIDLQGIRRFFGDAVAKEAEGWTTRKREKWLMENVTDEADDWLQARYINDGLISEFRAAVNDFDPTSPAELGRSIAIRAKNIDEPGFFQTAEGVSVANAMKYAKAQGWDLDAVLSAMRGRAAEWAGNDAPELFARMFRESSPRARVGTDAAPAVQALPSPIATFAQNLREVARLVDEERAAADATARDAAPATPEPAAPTEPAPMRLADPAPPKPELPIDKEATERLVVSLRKRESVLNKLMECMA